MGPGACSSNLPDDHGARRWCCHRAPGGAPRAPNARLVAHSFFSSFMGQTHRTDRVRGFLAPIPECSGQIPTLLAKAPSILSCSVFVFCARLLRNRPFPRARTDGGDKIGPRGRGFFFPLGFTQTGQKACFFRPIFIEAGADFFFPSVDLKLGKARTELYASNSTIQNGMMIPRPG